MGFEEDLGREEHREGEQDEYFYGVNDIAADPEPQIDANDRVYEADEGQRGSFVDLAENE